MTMDSGTRTRELVGLVGICAILLAMVGTASLSLSHFAIHFMNITDRCPVDLAASAQQINGCPFPERPLKNLIAF